jgi:putative ABC transport system permease protein
MPPDAPVAPMIEITWAGVLLLAAPVAVVLAMSGAMRLGQGRRITIAAVRSVVQLLAIGLIIGWVFNRNTWYWITALLIVMTLIAGFTGAHEVGRLGRGFLKLGALISVVLGAVTAAVLLYLSEAVIGLHAWDARYLIPLGGMLLGNAMTAATLGLERMGGELQGHGNEVEVALALGASPWQAVQPALRAGVRAALTPTINSMMIVGVVKLPGMMTGQMLGGAHPFEASLYQLMILIGILVTCGGAATLSGVLFHRRFFTPAWQLNRPALRGIG